MEEDFLYDDTKSMIRLKTKGKLIKDVCDIVGVLQRNRDALPKRMYKVAERSLSKDFKKGLKILNQHIPVYVELPKLKKEGNGVYSTINIKTGQEERVVNTVPAVVDYDIRRNEE